MRQATRAAIALVLMAAPALGYEEDTHYYLCFALARMSGLSEREAHIVASAAQAIDEAPATTPYKLSNIPTHGTGELERLKMVLPRWHAMSRSGDENEIALRRATLRSEAFADAGNLISLGKYAHFQQDWYSHQDEPGRHFTAPLGHFFKRHAPDLLGTDAKMAEEMAKAWMQDVRQFIEKSGRDATPPAGVTDEVGAKLLKMMIGKLIYAKKNELSHEETEALLNDLFRSQGLELSLPAYDKRLTYLFDEDGTPHAPDLHKDLPPIVLRLDAASRRVMDRLREEAATLGSLGSGLGQAAADAVREMEAARLDELAALEKETRLRRDRREADELRKEAELLGKEIARLEADIEKLTDVNKGPCVCGAATHAACKKGKECQDIERSMGEKVIEELRPKKARRAELISRLEALSRSIEAGTVALRLILERLEKEPLSAELRARLDPGVVLTPRLRIAIPKLLPYLPPGVLISSGYRSPERQLGVMRTLARKHGIAWREDAAVELPETWMEAWHALLKKEVVINPPIPAKRPDGRLVPATPHAKGQSFDIRGASLEAISAGLEKARREGVAILPQIKAEPVNDCVHVQVGD